MKDNIKKIIDIAQTLCDAVGDMPCGCDACPYVDTKKDDEDCEVYQVISELERVSDIEER